jgi:SAM-dependent methyltransferase
MSIYDPFARYYDADFRDYHDDLPFLREFARRTGGPLLELMCGTGRVLLPLAQAGFEVTGVDLSPAMLELARRRVESAGLGSQVTLIEGDATSVELPANTFNLAFVAVNSFMHLQTTSEQLALLASVRRALTRKGLLVIDLFNPDPREMLREDNRLLLDREYELDGCWVQKFIAIDTDSSAQTSAITYMYDETDRDGRLSRRIMRFTLRWLYRYELEHLLARTGFMIRSIYGSYDLDPYLGESPRLIAVATPAR